MVFGKFIQTLNWVANIITDIPIFSIKLDYLCFLFLIKYLLGLFVLIWCTWFFSPSSYVLFIFLLGVTPMAHSSHIVLDCPLGTDLTQQSLRHVPNQQSINVLPHWLVSEHFAPFYLCIQVIWRRGTHRAASSCLLSRLWRTFCWGGINTFWQCNDSSHMCPFLIKLFIILLVLFYHLVDFFQLLKQFVKMLSI